jgi:hypothetical protein
MPYASIGAVIETGALEASLTRLRLILAGPMASATQQFLGSNQRVGHSRLEGQCPTLAIGSLARLSADG